MYSVSGASERERENGFFYRGINLQHGELSLVDVLDVFLQRASSRSSVQIVNVIARAGPIYADERQRYAKNSGVHGVNQRLDILLRDELLLDRRLRPSFQFARWYVAAGYLNLIRILELLPCNQSFSSSFLLLLPLFFFFFLLSITKVGLRDAMRTLGRKADTVIRIDIRTT